MKKIKQTRKPKKKQRKRRKKNKIKRVRKQQEKLEAHCTFMLKYINVCNFQITTNNSVCINI